MRLIVSLVTHEPDEALLGRTLESLNAALATLADIDTRVLVVLNGRETRGTLIEQVAEAGLNHTADSVSVDKPGKNLGFGRAHNRALALMDTPGPEDFFLFLNPDVLQRPDALKQALDYLHAHPEVVALSPRAEFEDGTRQYLCKRYPSLLDFVLRGFAPASLRRLFARRLAAYEMRGLTEDQPVTDVELISGCYLLCRAGPLCRLGGFDAGYFLYFEDYDLSMRLREFGRLAYVPAVHIVHAGGHAARKGWRHRWLFMRSAARFFSTHGWKLL